MTALTILVRALVTLVVCWVIGLAVGAAATRIVEEHVRQYKLRHPLPPTGVETSADDSSSSPRNSESAREDQASPSKAA